VTPHDLPPLALSIRQPWAWAIIFAGKDIENRNWKQNYLLDRRGRVAVHAPHTISQFGYEAARRFMAGMGIECPAAIDLPRAGIIGSVEVVDVVDESNSRWFFGPRGLVLKDPLPHPFISALGALGYFKWEARHE
jgi:hypothetical protein